MPQVAANDKRLLEPYAYVSELPGKNVRGHLVDAFQQWLTVPKEAADKIKHVVDELHNASLLYPHYSVDAVALNHILFL